MRILTVLMMIGVQLGIAACAAGQSDRHTDFALKDGDTVVFLGDSITAEQTYGKVVENYSLLRYPDRRIRFINAGKGGDTAATGLERLERDVFARGATVVLVAFGINDIGWGMKADALHRKLYLDSIREIVRRCKACGVRVFICSPAPTGSDPYKAEGDFLTSMTSEGMRIARDAGENAIDILGTMRGIQKKFWRDNEQATSATERFTLHEKDTVHLNQFGQMAMAYAILEGLNAEAEIATASINLKTGRAETWKCRVTDVRTTAGGCEWQMTLERLPFFGGLTGNLANRYVPLSEELNRLTLAVGGLAPGKYRLSVGGCVTGTFSADLLESGVNIGMATADAWVPGTMWSAQAAALAELTDAKSELELGRRSAMFHVHNDQWNEELCRRSDAITASIEEMQRALAHGKEVCCVLEKID